MLMKSWKRFCYLKLFILFLLIKSYAIGLTSVPALTDGIYHIDSFILGAPKAAIFVGLQNDYATEYDDGDGSSILPHWTNCSNACNEKTNQVYEDPDYQDSASSVYSHSYSPNDSNRKSSLSNESSSCGSILHDSALENVDEEVLETEADDDEDATELEAEAPAQTEVVARGVAPDVAVCQAKMDVDVEAEADTETYTSDDSDLQNRDYFTTNVATNDIHDGKYYYKNHGYYVNDDEFVFVNSFHNDNLGVGMTEQCTLPDPALEECVCECRSECEYVYDCMPQSEHRTFGYDENQQHISTGSIVTTSANSPIAICDNSTSSSQTVIAESAATTTSSSSSSASSCETIAAAHTAYGVDDELSFEEMKTNELYTIPPPPPPPILPLPFLIQPATTSRVLCGTGPRKANRISPMPEAVNNYRFSRCFVPDCPSA